MNKKLKVAIILAICIILAILFIFVGKKKSIKYQTAIVEKGTVMEKVEATGTIKPVQTVEIGAQVSGMIKEVYVDYNSRVKKGQLLAQIDTSLFQAQVDQAQATLAVKQANYKKYRNQTAYKKATYVRYQKLYNQGYVSKDSLESAKTDYNVNLAETASTRADIQQASATLRNNLANLRYCRIVSPVDGVVISKNVEVGQTVASSFQTPTLFEVAQDLTKNENWSKRFRSWYR